MSAVLEATDTATVDGTPLPSLIDEPQAGEKRRRSVGRHPAAASLTDGLPSDDQDSGHPAEKLRTGTPTTTAGIEHISSSNADPPMAVERIHAGNPYAAKHRAPEAR